MMEGPDQGYAWIVALSCFMINFLMAGLARTVGVLYVALINLYGVSRQDATTPFSIRVCVRNLTGPFIGLLGQKYGIRGIVLVGGILAGLGSILCCFAPSIMWIILCWGVVHGMGFGLSTVLHMMMIGKYFDKYKASAMGLSYSGDCFGTFAFPVIIEYLLASYGLRSTFLILGGIVLNVVPMALLLKEPPWLTKKKKAKKESIKPTKDLTAAKFGEMHIQKRTSTEDHEVLEPPSARSCKENHHPSLQEDSPPAYEYIQPLPDKHLVGQSNLAFRSSDSDISSLNEAVENDASNKLRQLSLGHEQKPLGVGPLRERLSVPRRNQSFQNVHPSSMSSTNSQVCRSNSALTARHIRKIRSVSDLNVKNDRPQGSNKSPHTERVLQDEDRRDSLPPVLERETSLKSKSESVTNDENQADPALATVDNPSVPKKRTSSFVGSVAQEIVNRLRTASFASQVASDGFCAPLAQEPQVVEEEEMECELRSIVEHKDHDISCCTNKDRVLSVDYNVMNNYLKFVPERKESVKPKPKSMLMQLLKTNIKPIFILISVSMAAYALLFVSVLTIIIDYAKDLGISDDAGKFLVIGFSATDLVGRLTFGQVIDRKMMKMKNFAGCTMLIMGLLVGVIPLNVSFNYIMVCMCMYGFVQGGTAIMFPLLVNAYMDPQEESVAMGCLNFYGGLLMLLMAPMIGYYRDNIGSYNPVFYINGGVVAVVGILWQFEPMIMKQQKKKLREKYVMQVTITRL